MGLSRGRNISKKTTEDLYYLQSLQVQSSCATILTCPFHQKLIPQGDHLIKGCRYWRENSRIFAPEAA